ncbi:hypothetical protein BDZ85DRAFT_18884 [Elsinoe ampelina]|uniref:Uncharacterized protein n=1 Tax=Elsinoe ampelina TaxID=302913 RepID=A0A6A6G7P3_9PEZI|nr:hypothetical protein BDZ85DRAFT_18884 [Elsinoe ampelina]
MFLCALATIMTTHHDTLIPPRLQRLRLDRLHAIDIWHLQRVGSTPNSKYSFSVPATLRTSFRHSHQGSCTHHGRIGRDQAGQHMFLCQTNFTSCTHIQSFNVHSYSLHPHASNNGQVPEYRQDPEHSVSSLWRDFSPANSGDTNLTFFFDSEQAMSHQDYTQCMTTGCS